MPSNALNLAIEITAKDSTAGALSKTRAGLQSISDQLSATKAQFVAFYASMLSFGRVRALAEMADQVALVNARLKLAAGGAREFAQAQQLAYRVAAQTGAGYESVATLYGRLAPAARGFGLTQEQVAQTTEATALALKVSGASASEAAAVVRQFSQALGSGVLRGDEFNSLMENGARLAQALADGLGLPVGELRALAEQGLLTTDVIVKALLPQLDKLRQESESMPKTIGAAASEMKDAFGRVVDEFNRATGATSGVAGAISAMARNMDDVLRGAAVVAVGALTAALARGGQAAAASIAQIMAKIAADRQAAISAQAVAAHEVAKAQAMLSSAQAAVAAASGMARLTVVQTQLVPAQQRLAAAQAAANAAAAAGAGVARGLSTALGLVGGPLGAILTLLTMGATAWAVWGDKAKTAADKAMASAEAAREALARVERERKYGVGDAATFREEIARLEARKSALEESARVTYRGRPSAEMKSELAAVEADLKRYRDNLAFVEEKEKSIADTAYDNFGLKRKAVEQFVDSYRAKIDPLKAALDELKKKFQDARMPLDSKEYREAEAIIRRSFAKKTEAPAMRLPRLVESFDAELAAMRASLKTSEDTLEASFRARLVKEEAYWQAKGEMQRRALDLEAQDLRRQIADQRRLVDSLGAMQPKDAAQKQDIAERIEQAKNRLSELQIKMAEIDGRRMVVDLEVTSNLDRARREIDDLKANLRERIAEAAGGMTTEMRRAAIERANRELLEKMAGDAEGEALARRMIDVEAAKAEMTALESSWRLALETMRNAEQSANIQREQGLITTAEAQARIAGAHRLAAAEMDALLPKLEAVANALGPEAVARVAAYRNELMQVGQVVDPVAASLNTSLKDAFAGMFEQIGSGAKSAKEAFLDFARSVLAAINRILAQQLAERLFGKGGFDLGGIVKSGLSFFGIKFASGGYVAGPGTSTSDSIPARLSAGEYVIRAEAVRRFGVAFLDAINGLRLTPARQAGRLAFAAGGLVPAVAPAAMQQPIRIVNAVDPELARDYLESPAGERVLVNVITRNAGAIRNILGG